MEGRGRRCSGAERSGPVLARHPRVGVSAAGEGPGSALSPSPSCPVPRAAWGRGAARVCGSGHCGGAGLGATPSWTGVTTNSPRTHRRCSSAAAGLGLPRPYGGPGGWQDLAAAEVPGEGQLRRRRGARARWSLYLRLWGLGGGSTRVRVGSAPSPRLGEHGGVPTSRLFSGALVPSHAWHGDGGTPGQAGDARSSRVQGWDGGETRGAVGRRRNSRRPPGRSWNPAGA